MEQRVEQLRQHDEQDLKHKEAAAAAGGGKDTRLKNDERGGQRQSVRVMRPLGWKNSMRMVRGRARSGDAELVGHEATRLEELNENGQGESKERRS